MKRIFSLIALTAAMFAAIAVDAAALSENDAGIAASRWARRSRLGVRLTEQRSGTRRYVTSRGDVFYGVRLGTSGSVIVGDVGGSARVLAFSRQPLGVISTNRTHLSYIPLQIYLASYKDSSVWLYVLYDTPQNYFLSQAPA